MNLGRSYERKRKQLSPEAIKKMHEDYEFPTPNELQHLQHAERLHVRTQLL